MSGQDKGLIRFNGEPFVVSIARQLKPQCGKVIINANRNLPEYKSFGYDVVEDQLSDFQGPLAGILSALKVIDTEWLVTTPCDGPWVEQQYVEKLAKCIQIADQTQIVVAKAFDRIQPVYALIHASLAISLETYLNSGERKIDRWYFQQHYRTKTFEDTSSMFLNINTPEELEALKS